MQRTGFGERNQKAKAKGVIGYVKALTLVGEMNFGNIAERIFRFKSGEKQQKTTKTAPICYSGSSQYQGIKNLENPLNFYNYIF